MTISATLKALHPDLKDSIVDHQLFGTMIDHRLVKIAHLDRPFPFHHGNHSSWTDYANSALASKQTALTTETRL